MVRELKRIFFTAFLSVGGAVGAPVDALVPYEVDADTLHLWHLDEEGPPFQDEGPFSTSLMGLFNGAKTRQSALLGLGHAVSFHHEVGGVPGEWSLQGAILTAAPQLSNGPADCAPESLHWQGGDGAFTYEALVKLDLMPSEAEVIALAILTMDGENGGPEVAERIFNFRIERQGFLAFAPLDNSQAKGGAIASLPKSGIHAVNTSDWFHVAVTYNGQEEQSNNLLLYWTRIGSGASVANLIGSGSLSCDFDQERRGDFAIGNEARTSLAENAEAEPFPGCIDEVRISSVARHPSDFLFVPKDLRLSSNKAKADELRSRGDSALELGLVGILVDGKRISTDSLGGPLVLSPGLHRLDFDLSFSQEQMAGPVQLRTQLVGVDDTWRSTPLGMNFFFEALDSSGQVISQARSAAIGSSFGWVNWPEESKFVERSEPLFLPREAKALRITLDSGSPDTTGTFVVDDLSVLLPGGEGQSLWRNGNFLNGDNLNSAAGVPTGWKREGGDPAIAQLVTTSKKTSLAVIDGDQQRSGNWSSSIPLDPSLHGGKTVAIRWQELYNITSGNTYRASYTNVPAGSYTFRAVWLSDQETISSGEVELPIEVPLLVRERAWFWPLIASLIVALVALIIIREVRRINRRKLRQLWIQNTLERDRIRIARDMHDDLGTRVSVLNINAALVKHELDRDPEKARRHLDKLDTSARELVVAMKDLVWAVDPSHDTLEHLAAHLTRLAEDLFSDGPIRCRLDIPATFPEHQLGSDFRQHISLAVKEALNNVLKHAGPCEVYLSMACEDSILNIEVRDDGCGFDPKKPNPSHHGLRNFVSRLEGLGGTCEISSSLGEGTCIAFSCPIHQEPASIIP